MSEPERPTQSAQRHSVWNRLLLAVISVVALLAVAGCRGTQFDRSGMGQFPARGPSQYVAILYLETRDPGSLFSLQNKDVWIRVEDPEGNRLLDDRLPRMRSGMVEGKVRWTDFNHLEVELLEVGYAKSDDPYAVALAKSGPRPLLSLTYQYNHALKKFERVN